MYRAPSRHFECYLPPWESDTAQKKRQNQINQHWNVASFDSFRKWLIMWVGSFLPRHNNAFQWYNSMFCVFIVCLVKCFPFENLSWTDLLKSLGCFSFQTESHRFAFTLRLKFICKHLLRWNNDVKIKTKKNLNNLFVICHTAIE